MDRNFDPSMLVRYLGSAFFKSCLAWLALRMEGDKAASAYNFRFSCAVSLVVACSLLGAALRRILQSVTVEARVVE